MVSGLKRELKWSSDSSCVVRDIKEEVPVITAFFKQPSWIIHLSCCKKAAAVVLWLISMHRAEGVIIIFGMAACFCHSCAMLGGSWGLPSPGSAPCLGSMGALSLLKWRGTWNMLWYLPPLILLLGVRVLNKSHCCSVGMSFHWLLFTGFPLYCTAVPLCWCGRRQIVPEGLV